MREVSSGRLARASSALGVPALYVWLRFETAWLEAQQAFPFKAQPMTLCGYQVDCEDIADLSDAATLVALGVDRTALACPWEYLAGNGETPPSWRSPTV